MGARSTTATQMPMASAGAAAAAAEGVEGMARTHGIQQRHPWTGAGRAAQLLRQPIGVGRVAVGKALHQASTKHRLAIILHQQDGMESARRWATLQCHHQVR